MAAAVVPDTEPLLEAELGPGPPDPELELGGDELVLEDVDVHIQANLEDALVQEALKTGVDLRQYSKQVELELQEVERASIRDYIKESENIAALHNQITACDAILERMEQMLSSFQSDLSSISSEIRTLQEQSVAMNLRLRNRRRVRLQLGQLLEELVVPGAMISTILEAPVTEPEFLEQLQELDGKINSVKEQAFRETVACADVQHVLEKLKIKAVTKIREFILQKIYSFRKPMTNYQIPQNALLKYRFFYRFLLGNERPAAQELREHYVDTMSKIYLSYFKSYTSRLMKIQYEEVADKDDLMGVEDTAKKDILSLGGHRELGPFGAVWVHLGRFGSIRGGLGPFGAVWVHSGRFGSIRGGFGSIWGGFGSIQGGLGPFGAVLGPFGAILSPFEAIWGHSGLFGPIQGGFGPIGGGFGPIGGGFGPIRSRSGASLTRAGFFSKPQLRCRNTVFTLGNRGSIISAAELEAPILVPHAAQRSDTRYPFESLFRSQHYALLDNSCREFLFLCDFFLVTGPSAQELFNSVMGKTLAMFLKHMDTYVSACYDAIAVFLCIHIVLRFRNIMAKRNVPAVERYWGTLLELLWPRFELLLELHIGSIRSTDPQRLGCLDTRPHYITRRYAEFSSAIVSINQTFPNEKTNALLGQLQVEVENFVLRVAAEFSSRKEQLIFLINNYDMMLGVLMERAVEESKEVEGFQQLLSARTQEFIEELLSPPFGGMIAFVKEAEALLEKGQLEQLRGEEGRVTQLARGFSSTWRSAVEALSQDVMRSFSNFKNGTGIIQGALTQLIQYYHRFHKVLAQPPLRSLPVRADLINIHHLMVELKKHKPNF